MPLNRHEYHLFPKDKSILSSVSSNYSVRHWVMTQHYTGAAWASQIIRNPRFNSILGVVLVRMYDPKKIHLYNMSANYTQHELARERLKYYDYDYLFLLAKVYMNCAMNQAFCPKVRWVKYKHTAKRYTHMYQQTMSPLGKVVALRCQAITRNNVESSSIGHLGRIVCEICIKIQIQIFLWSKCVW